MFGSFVRFLKRILPAPLKRWIKRMMGAESPLPGMPEGSSNINRYNRIMTDPAKINIAINCGGGIGDFIVYKALFDQLLDMGDCHISLFTFSYANANLIVGGYDNLAVYYPFYAVTSEDYDLHLSIDHWIEVKGHIGDRIKKLAPKLYDAVGTIAQSNSQNHIDYGYYLLVRNAVMYRARIMGLNRWTALAYGSVFDMKTMRSGLLCDETRVSFLTRYGLDKTPYITIQYGADREMGGTRQVKVWPLYRYEEFTRLFKVKYPMLKIVQIAANKEPEIDGVDILIKNAELEDVKLVLKNARTHLSGEGGIAHLATQMGTRCAVMFGPTPAYYYGYPTNVNVVSPACSECMEATEGWAVSCPRKYDRPICMDSITGEMALSAVAQILEEEITHNHN